MTKNVSRVVVVAVAIAAMLSLFSYAEGQYASQNPVNPETANTGFLGFQTLNPQPSSDPAAAAADTTTVGGTGGGLAITGAETDVPLAIGIGLLALGGTAVVAGRTRKED